MSVLVKKSRHQLLVEETLPRFAEDLRREGVIVRSHRRRFNIDSFKCFAPFTIKPDLVVVLADERQFLVEIVPQRDIKRFLGELTCIQFLGRQRTVDAAIIFLLPKDRASKVPAMGVRLLPSRKVSAVLPQKTPSMVFLWSTREDFTYNNLKTAIKVLRNTAR
jgi:hypothetical protein